MPATGLARSRGSTLPDPHLAFAAVQSALERLGSDRASSVLLFLTGHFARDPSSAIHAAARAAQTTQIAGCTAVGVYTEADWVIDVPAAAALVFAPGEDEREPQPSLDAKADDWLLSLAGPGAVNREWLALPGQRVGALSGDGTGRGPFPVWSSGKLMDSGRLDLHLPWPGCRIIVSPGLTPLSSLVEVTEVREFDLVRVGHRPALSALVAQALPHLDSGQEFPWHRLLVARADDEPRLALASGDYELMPVLGVNPNRSLLVGGRLLEGDRIFSVLREPQQAKQEVDARLASLRSEGAAPTAPGAASRSASELAPQAAAKAVSPQSRPASQPAPQSAPQREPRFVLLFNCSGRGPAFFDGRDADWDSVRRVYPGRPLIGFYGNGEIAPSGGRNRLFQYASVCALVG